MKLEKMFPIIIFVACVIVFFQAFLFKGNLPIPSDTIIGLYHPFRDLYAKDYPRGIPFKNFLITDPVRQQYPWRDLSIGIEKKLQFPLWNPYNFGGTPLLANFQTAAFYPLNILFFILPFTFAWSFLVILQLLLAGLFMYAYLIHIKLNKWACFLGAFVFSFSGFSIAWLEWNTIGHTALWMPLILLSIDKLVVNVKGKKQFAWLGVFLFSLVSSFFAGHLQTFFYLYLISLVYFFARWVQVGKQKNILLLFIILNSLFIIITSMQWIPSLQFISESARSVDQVDWQKDGWFIPIQNLIQFIVPDFFGNPTTLNYWGVWNYVEFIGYIGILPLLMAMFALFFRRDKKTLFFGTFFLLSLIFSVQNSLSKIPFALNLPFISTAQPTRLLFITDFSLAVLCALGLDYFFRNKKGILYPLAFVALIFLGSWAYIGYGFGNIAVENISVAKRNIFLPTIIFTSVSILLFSLWKYKKINKHVILIAYIMMIGISIFDVLRFANKFTPFTKKEYLFPQTQIISFLQKQPGHFRIMTTDDRILPPNFSTIYKIQSIDGYDPLYLRRYGELIAVSERGKPDISPPFGFNRIITPHIYDSKIIDLLGVKYVLSLSDIDSPKLKKVFQEGQTRVYENIDVLPRAFFVNRIRKIYVENKEEAIKEMFKEDFDMIETAIIDSSYDPSKVLELPSLPYVIGKAEILKYEENVINIKTENEGKGFLVLTDAYYPSWHAKIDGIETEIYRTNYNFRGVIVPKGEHIIEFYIALF